MSSIDFETDPRGYEYAEERADALRARGRVLQALLEYGLVPERAALVEQIATALRERKPEPTERKQEDLTAAYQSPTHKVIEFEFEDLLRGTERGPGRYPMRCYFTGAYNRELAAAFESELLKDGVGVLNHPVHGKIDVVPLGAITWRQKANRSVVEVTFWTTLPIRDQILNPANDARQTFHRECFRR